MVMPGDGDVGASLEQFTAVDYQRYDVDGGAEAVNALLPEIHTDYVALVRKDVVVTQDWLSRLYICI